MFHLQAKEERKLSHIGTILLAVINLYVPGIKSI